MAFRSGLRLALTSSKLGFRLVQQQGLPLNGHNYIPALQNVASRGEVVDDRAAALRLIELYRKANLIIYNFQKHGARHALREVLPQRLLGGMNRVSASSTGSFPENKVGAPPMNERLIGTERRSLTTGRVAFVITNATRAKLAALGHSTEKVKEMRPAEALAVVDEQIGPNELEGFLQALRTAPPSTPSAPAPSKSSEKEEVVTPKPSEVNYTRTEEAAEEASSQAPTPQQPPSLTSSPSSTSTTAAPPYDMSAEIRKLRADIKAKKNLEQFTADVSLGGAIDSSHGAPEAPLAAAVPGDATVESTKRGEAGGEVKEAESAAADASPLALLPATHVASAADNGHNDANTVNSPHMLPEAPPPSDKSKGDAQRGR